MAIFILKKFALKVNLSLVSTVVTDGLAPARGIGKMVDIYPAYALELLQSCIKPWYIITYHSKLCDVIIYPCSDHGR